MENGIKTHTLMGKKLVIGKYVSDSQRVKRTWRDRLFSLTPFRTHRYIEGPCAYITEDMIVVSRKTFMKIMAEDSVVIDRIASFVCQCSRNEDIK